jgi:hypothetical protein
MQDLKSKIRFLIIGLELKSAKQAKKVCPKMQNKSYLKKICNLCDNVHVNVMGPLQKCVGCEWTFHLPCAIRAFVDAGGYDLSCPHCSVDDYFGLPFHSYEHDNHEVMTRDFKHGLYCQQPIVLVHNWAKITHMLDHGKEDFCFLCWRKACEFFYKRFRWVIMGYYNRFAKIMTAEQFKRFA